MVYNVICVGGEVQEHSHNAYVASQCMQISHSTPQRMQISGENIVHHCQSQIIHVKWPEIVVRIVIDWPNKYNEYVIDVQGNIVTPHQNNMSGLSII